MNKLLIISLVSIMLASNVNAGTDGENDISNKNQGQVKDCFESINRATFKFNHVLDNVIFKGIFGYILS